MFAFALYFIVVEDNTQGTEEAHTKMAFDLLSTTVKDVVAVSEQKVLSHMTNIFDAVNTTTSCLTEHSKYIFLLMQISNNNMMAIHIHYI